MALIYILAVLLGILSISLLIVKSCLRNKVRHFILFWSETLTKGDRDIEKMLDFLYKSRSHTISALSVAS